MTDEKKESSEGLYEEFARVDTRDITESERLEIMLKTLERAKEKILADKAYGCIVAVITRDAEGIPDSQVTASASPLHLLMAAANVLEAAAHAIPEGKEAIDKLTKIIEIMAWHYAQTNSPPEGNTRH